MSGRIRKPAHGKFQFCRVVCSACSETVAGFFQNLLRFSDFVGIEIEVLEYGGFELFFCTTIT